MAGSATENNRPATLSERDFRRLAEVIYSECGIRMTPHKMVMVEARLRKRLRALGYSNFGDYCAYLFSDDGMEEELVQMINVITTNKTDYFREPRHFEALVQTALPRLAELYGAGKRRPVAIWSAGCSTGEEPYTLAMVLSEYALANPGFQYTILATDISTVVLEKARRAVYSADRVEVIPVSLRKKYLLRSKDRSKNTVRVIPGLRSAVSFRRLNFMDHDFGMRELQDIIFCRNVIIYFDRPTQERVLKRLCRHLVPGGYLFMGHSETLSGLNVPLVSEGATIYRKPA